jgi:hypothetical protein
MQIKRARRALTFLFRTWLHCLSLATASSKSRHPYGKHFNTLITRFRVFSSIALLYNVCMGARAHLHKPFYICRPVNFSK